MGVVINEVTSVEDALIDKIKPIEAVLVMRPFEESSNNRASTAKSQPYSKGV